MCKSANHFSIPASLLSHVSNVDTKYYKANISMRWNACMCLYKFEHCQSLWLNHCAMKCNPLSRSISCRAGCSSGEVVLPVEQLHGQNHAAGGGGHASPLKRKGGPTRLGLSGKPSRPYMRALYSAQSIV